MNDALITRLRAKSKSSQTYSNRHYGEAADALEESNARIAELKKIVDVMHADGDKNDARVVRYKAIASKAIREQVAIREDYEAIISELKSALTPFVEEYQGWSEDDYKYVPANVLRARSALARVKDGK